MSEKTINKERAAKKVEIAINKIVDLQDAGYGGELTSKILDLLNELEAKINSGQ